MSGPLLKYSMVEISIENHYGIYANYTNILFYTIITVNLHHGKIWRFIILLELKYYKCALYARYLFCVYYIHIIFR